MMKPDNREFLELIEAHRGLILKVCRLYARDAEEQRDLEQEIVYQLWRSRERFEGRAAIGTWVYRLALNVAITGLRKQYRRREDRSLPIPEAISRDSELILEQHERKEQLHLAIRKLGKIERALILLYLEEKSYKEIAEVMGISVNLVGVRINRIKQKLKKMLMPIIGQP